MTHMTKIRRNDPCPCGSGKKYKRCCQPIVDMVWRLTGSKNTVFPLKTFAQGAGIDPELAGAYFSRESMDILTWTVSELVLLRNLTNVLQAIRLCVSQSHPISALKLIYSAIDNLAYLGDARSVVKNRFTNWANNYLLPDSGLECTARELWGARCGLLHQNTAATRDLGVTTRRICYVTGSSRTEKGAKHVTDSARPRLVFVSVDALENALRVGTAKFIAAAVRVPVAKERLLRLASDYFAIIADESES